MEPISAYFNTRSMVQAIEQWKTPQTFFQRLFFNEIITHATRYVEIDFFNQKRRIAPFIHRRASGTAFEKTGYDKFIWEPPYVKPRSNIEPKDLQETLMGQNPYDVVDPGMRFMQLRNMILKELDDSISRREELMAVQAAFNKSITITDENGNAIDDAITFTRESELEFTASPLWTSASTCKPLTDIRTAAKLIAKHTGLNPDIAVHGSTNADNFLEATQVQTYLNRNSGYSLGSVQMTWIGELESMGAKFIGEIEGVKHFRYDAWYQDPATGTVTSMIPATKTLVGCSQARNIRHYGAIETVEADINLVRARRWPKFYDAKNLDPEVYGVQLHSAPLPVMHQPNAFAVITGA